MADNFLDFGIVDTSITPLPEGVEDFFSQEDVASMEKIVPGAAPAPAKTTTAPTQTSSVPVKETTPSPSTEEIEKSIFNTDEEETDDGKEDEKEKNVEDDKNVNQFEALSKNLYELGIFESEEDEKGNSVIELTSTPEEFKDLWEKQKLKAAETTIYNFLSSRHGDEGIKMFEDVFQSGVSPRDYLADYVEIQDLSTLDLSLEAHQEQIIREDGKRRNIPADKVEKRIQRLKDMASLQEEAEDILPQLKAQSEKKLADRVEAEKQKTLRDQQADNQYKLSVTKSLQENLKKKEYDGIPLNDETANKVFDFLYTPKYVSNGKKLTEFDVFILESKKPENISKRIKTALLAMNDFDFSKIQKKAVSTESKTLFKEFVQKKAVKNTPISKSDDSGWKL